MSLTRHPPASLREIFSLSIPLMLTSLSFFAMIFVDRLFLSAYDLDAMTAAVNSSIVGIALTSGLGIIGSIAEVFVGRHYGAKEYRSIGAPVWQMIWLSICSAFIYLPFGFWGIESIFGAGRDFEAVYLRWMMLTAPVAIAYQPLAAFFIGRGKTDVIVWVALATNVINIVLDYILIFGVEGWIAPMGIEGAAIATSFGACFQTLIFFGLFLRKKYREKYATLNCKFNFSLFKECVVIGFPAGVSITLELLGWSFFYEMMRELSDNHILLAGIFQSILLLFFFFPEGLNKAVTAIVSNYIGEKREDLIPKVIRSALTLSTLAFIGALLLSPFAVDAIRLSFFNGKIGPIDHLLFGGWFVVILYITFFEPIRTTYLALLTSYKETRYILLSGTISTVFFVLIPFKLLLTFNPSELNALMFALLFPLGHAFLLYLRSRPLIQKPASLAAA